MTPRMIQSIGSSRRTYCGCLGSCCSAVRKVTRWRGTWYPTLGGSPTRPCTSCPRSVVATMFLRARIGHVLGGVEGSFGGADHSRLSSPSSARVPRAVYDWSASRPPLRVRHLARGPRPARLFHHGLVVVPPDGNFLPFTLNLSFHFI
jgi:hypothetical protein